MQIPYWVWGGSCKFRTDLGGAGLAPVFRPPQHFSNEHALNPAIDVHMCIFSDYNEYLSKKIPVKIAIFIT